LLPRDRQLGIGKNLGSRSIRHHGGRPFTPVSLAAWQSR